MEKFLKQYGWGAAFTIAAILAIKYFGGKNPNTPIIGPMARNL